MSNSIELGKNDFEEGNKIFVIISEVRPNQPA